MLQFYIDHRGGGAIEHTPRAQDRATAPRAIDTSTSRGPYLSIQSITVGRAECVLCARRNKSTFARSFRRVVKAQR